MQMSVECRRAEERSLGMMMKEIDEDLVLFLEMRAREKEKNDLIFDESPSDSTGTTPEEITKNTFLDAPENAESDFDWLFLPPFSPSAPLTEAQLHEAPFQVEIPKGATTDLESEKVLQPKETSSTIVVDTSSTRKSSIRLNNRRLFSSGAGKSAVSRLPTPSRRPLAASSKLSTSSTTFNSKGTPSSVKPMAPSTKSSIPSKSAARSTSTPPARSTLSSSSKASTRSVTPTPKTCTVPGPTSCPSIDKKTGSKTSRGVSAPMRSRPKEKTVVLLSASINGRSRQKACSPLKEKANLGPFNTRNTSYRVSRGYSNGNDDEANPLLVGTKMVERVVNMRKLAPPKDDYQPLDDHIARKSSSDKSGFGRSLSNKSLDMAIRHMDIRNKVPVNLNRKRVPASSGRVTKTGAFLAQLTSTDSEDSVSSSSIAPDGSGNGSYF